MKIGYFGDGPWSHLALERVLGLTGVTVAFITARHDAPDPVLRDWARALDVPFFTFEDVNAPAVIGQIAEFATDLLVSMSFNQILRSEILSVAPLGFVNCHAGALPFYRGRNPLNWALINGEERFGVTVHHVDLGIDTGDIIVQRFTDIAVDDSYGTVLPKAYELCAETLCEALRRMADGTATRTPQSDIDPVGFYCGRRRPGDEWIDWRWDSARAHNFIRAIALPAPCARTYLGDRPLALLQSALIAKAPRYLGTPGEVVGRDTSGVVVKTGDATLRVLSVAELDGDGMPGPAFTPRFAIGTRFSDTVFAGQARGGGG